MKDIDIDAEATCHSQLYFAMKRDITTKPNIMITTGPMIMRFMTTSNGTPASIVLL